MKKNTSSRSSWHRFGTILGRFVTALGVIFIDFLLVFKAFREISLFAKNIVPRAVLSPTWPVLGRFWHPKSSPNASPKRLQNDQKSYQKNKTKKERKKTPNRPKKSENAGPPVGKFHGTPPHTPPQFLRRPCRGTMQRNSQPLSAALQAAFRHPGMPTMSQKPDCRAA